jgi:hypothetical protein
MSRGEDASGAFAPPYPRIRRFPPPRGGIIVNPNERGQARVDSRVFGDHP